MEFQRVLLVACLLTLTQSSRVFSIEQEFRNPNGNGKTHRENTARMRTVLNNNDDEQKLTNYASTNQQQASQMDIGDDDFLTDGESEMYSSDDAHNLSSDSGSEEESIAMGMDDDPYGDAYGYPVDNDHYPYPHGLTDDEEDLLEEANFEDDDPTLDHASVTNATVKSHDKFTSENSDLMNSQRPSNVGNDAKSMLQLDQNVAVVNRHSDMTHQTTGTDHLFEGLKPSDVTDAELQSMEDGKDS